MKHGRWNWMSRIFQIGDVDGHKNYSGNFAPCSSLRGKWAEVYTSSTKKHKEQNSSSQKHMVFRYPKPRFLMVWGAETDFDLISPGMSLWMERLLG